MLQIWNDFSLNEPVKQPLDVASTDWILAVDSVVHGEGIESVFQIAVDHPQYETHRSVITAQIVIVGNEVGNSTNTNIFNGFLAAANDDPLTTIIWRKALIINEKIVAHDMIILRILAKVNSYFCHAPIVVPTPTGTPPIEHLLSAEYKSSHDAFRKTASISAAILGVPVGPLGPAGP